MYDSQSENLFSMIGRVLGLKILSEADMFRVAERRISPRAYRRAVAKLNLPSGLIGPDATIRRRLRENERLTKAESERLLRVVRVYAEATRLFGTETTSADWMNTPAPFVQDREPVKPFELAVSDSGARLLESLILRTTYGML